MTCEQCYVCEQTVLQCSRTSIQPPPPKFGGPIWPILPNWSAELLGF